MSKDLVNYPSACCGASGIKQTGKPIKNLQNEYFYYLDYILLYRCQYC